MSTIEKLEKLVESAEASGQVGSLDRREFLRAMGAGTGIIAGLEPSPLSSQQQSLNVSDHYSPRNASRALRPHTDYIILHTTEGGSRGSLDRITRSGLAHYVVDVDGHVYRTIEKNRIARHAGRSMWNNTRNLDNYSIGIEIVGYHNRDITVAQYAAVKQLIAELQNIYDVPDNHVLAHAMVAYGWNRWYKAFVRGRRKDPMLLYSNEESLRKLGITETPSFDPDVRAGRLKSIDGVLATALYGDSPSDVRVAIAEMTGPNANVVSDTRTAWLIAGDNYDNPSTTYEMPNGTRITGDKISDWSKIPAGTRVSLGETLTLEGSVEDVDGFMEMKRGDTALSIAGDQFDSYMTIYFLSDGRVRTGAQIKLEDSTEFNRLQPGTKILIGYQYGGHVTSGRTPSDIAGSRWNHPSTFYRFPDGTIKSGDEIDPTKIPTGRFGTLVLLRR